MYKRLQQYINKGYFNRWQAWQSAISRQYVFRSNAVQIIRERKEWLQQMNQEAGETVRFSIPPYSDDLSHAEQLRAKLSDDGIRPNIHSLIVHGSVGTGEVIPYSDFDALVILKDAVFESPQKLAEVARKLFEAQSVFYRFDPLQHHGWFVLSQDLMRHYDEAWLPLVVIKEGKQLLGEGEQALTFTKQQAAPSFRQAFDGAVRHFTSRLTGHPYPQNSWELKGILSLFMLMPSLYLQAKAQKGISKKESFSLAEKDFDPGIWAIMREVSAIRRAWPESLKHNASMPRDPGRKASKTAPPVPVELKKKLTGAFYQRMIDLVNAMQAALINNRIY